MAPILPHNLRRAATTTLAAAADTRIIDSRQLQHLSATARRIASAARHIVTRIPTLLKRQDVAYCDNGFIDACYQGIDAGPAPGAVVGIVLGSIVGFLFILWVLWLLSNSSSFIRTSTLREEEDVRVVERHRSRSPRSRRSHRSSHHAEMRHSSPRRERVVRQERIVRDIPPPREREASRLRETVIVDESRPERRVDGDDIVEVYEEHDSSVGGGPPPRRKSRRSSGYNR